jgi:hypothetical protein
MNAIKVGKFDFSKEAYSGISALAIDFAKKMLTYDPA